MEGWSPWLHVFVLVYAGAIFFLLAVLHPESIVEDFDMLEHFLEHRKMFFGTFFATAVIDIVDTLIKDQLGLPAPPTLVYLPFMLLWMVTSAVAFVVSNRTFHAMSASLFLIILIVWISWMLSGIMGFVLVNQAAGYSVDVGSASAKSRHAHYEALANKTAKKLPILTNLF